MIDPSVCCPLPKSQFLYLPGQTRPRGRHVSFGSGHLASYCMIPTYWEGGVCVGRVLVPAPKCQWLFFNSNFLKRLQWHPLNSLLLHRLWIQSSPRQTHCTHTHPHHHTAFHLLRRPLNVNRSTKIIKTWKNLTLYPFLDSSRPSLFITPTHQISSNQIRLLFMNKLENLLPPKPQFFSPALVSFKLIQQLIFSSWECRYESLEPQPPQCSQCAQSEDDQAHHASLSCKSLSLIRWSAHQLNFPPLRNANLTHEPICSSSN